MANWAWLYLVCLGHNLCCWLQVLGRLCAGRDGAGLKAKRLRYRYLVVPALVVRSARRLSVKLAAPYPHLDRFVEARQRPASAHLCRLRTSNWEHTLAPLAQRVLRNRLGPRGARPNTGLRLLHCQFRTDGERPYSQNNLLRALTAFKPRLPVVLSS
jgi:hypothetical protein